MNIPNIKNIFPNNPINDLVGVSPMSKEVFDNRTAIKQMGIPLEQFTSIETKYAVNMRTDTLEELEEKLEKIIKFRKSKNNSKTQRIMDFFTDEDDIVNLIVKDVGVEIMNDLEKDIRKEIEKRKSNGK